MLQIKYAGNKPMISCTGISFEGKQDKYNYIEPSIQILNRLLDSKKTQNIDNNECLAILYGLVPDFDKFYNAQMDSYKQKLDIEEEKVKEDVRLNSIEKEVLKSNYKYVRDYRIQRATNKLVYEEIVNTVVKLIKEKEIKNIKTPPSMRFLHVLGSLKSTMDMKKVAISSQIALKLESNHPHAELSIV